MHDIYRQTANNFCNYSLRTSLSPHQKSSVTTHTNHTIGTLSAGKSSTASASTTKSAPGSAKPVKATNNPKMPRTCAA